MSSGSSNLRFEFPTRLMFCTFATVRGTVRGLSLCSAISVVNIIASAATLYVGAAQWAVAIVAGEDFIALCRWPLEREIRTTTQIKRCWTLEKNGLTPRSNTTRLGCGEFLMRTNSSPPLATIGNHKPYDNKLHQRNPRRRDGIANADRGDGGSRPRHGSGRWSRHCARETQQYGIHGGIPIHNDLDSPSGAMGSARREYSRSAAASELHNWEAGPRKLQD